MAYITDATTFSTVNASANNALTPPAPQSGIDFYFPSMVSQVWYRYYETLSTSISEVSERLSVASVGGFNGVMQKLSNLIVGQSYDIIVNKQHIVGSNTKLYIYSNLRLISTHTFTSLGTGQYNDQIIRFTASSTEDTLVMGTENVSSVLLINSIKIVTTPRTLEPNPNEVVYPSMVSERGIVTFTDGVNAILPSQKICESYGYEYNKVLGTCSSFTYNTELFSSVSNKTNKFYGTRNIAQTGTTNTLIMGENNTLGGDSRNSIIIGSNNVIDYGINNANVTGTLGEATVDNSIVLGGNAGADVLAERQNITVIYGTTTTNNSTVDSYLNNTVNSYFEIPINSIVTFKTETVAVRIGGSGGGDVGDFKAWSEQGAAINKSGVLSIDKTRTNIASAGTTSGWVPNVGVSGTKFLQQVKGANNRDIKWATTIRFTQIKTGVTL
jgi:hypothetical protein